MRGFGGEGVSAVRGRAVGSGPFGAEGPRVLYAKGVEVFDEVAGREVVVVNVVERRRLRERRR